jgi:putative ABC transport system permease protein
MILRHLERRPVKSLLSIFGIALAVSVLILGNFMLDAVNFVMETQFTVSQRQDVTIAFVEPTSGRVLSELSYLPGLRRAEPFRSVGVRLRAGSRARRVGVLGLRSTGELYRLVDRHRRPVALPAEGLVLSGKLGEMLGVGIGDRVRVEVLEGERPVREVMVAGLIDDFSGTSAYMNLDAVNRLLREGSVVSGAYLAADARQLDALYAALKEAPRVGSVTIKMAALDSFRRTVAENLLRMRLFNIFFACVIACGVVYNSARIALAERARDLATLRVLGFTRGEISFILLGELGVLTAVAIPVGLALGYGLGWLVIKLAYDTELFRMPLVIGPQTYGFAAAVTLAAALATGLVVRRRLDHLDLVAVLKSRE